jgi:hypothetical protein
MKVIQRVYLGVSSATLEPSTITARLGLDPDETVLKGSRLRAPGAKPLPVCHLWRLHSGARATLQLDHHIRALLDRVAIQAAAIRALAATGEAGIYVAAVRTFVPEPGEAQPDDGDAMPRDDAAGFGFHLDSALLAQLADLGIGLDVDEYG